MNSDKSTKTESTSRLNLLSFENLFQSDTEWKERINEFTEYKKQIEEKDKEKQIEDSKSEELQSELDLLKGDLIELKKIIDQDNVTYAFEKQVYEKPKEPIKAEVIENKDQETFQIDDDIETDEDFEIGLDLIQETDFQDEDIEHDSEYEEYHKSGETARQITTKKHPKLFDDLSDDGEETDSIEDEDEEQELEDEGEIDDLNTFQEMDDEEDFESEAEQNTLIETEKKIDQREITEPKKEVVGEPVPDQVSSPNLYAAWEKTTEFILDEAGQPTDIYQEDSPPEDK